MGYADHEKESKLASQEIKELKEELQKNKTISDIEFKFEEKKLRAREQALLRIHAQLEKKLCEELEELRREEEMEQTVHDRARKFLEYKNTSLQNQKEQWQKDWEREAADAETNFNAL